MSKQIIKTRLILYDKGRILLLKRQKALGGTYTFVGGTVKKEEFAKASLVREAFEESGIILEEKDLQLAHVLHKIDGKSTRVILYFKSAKWKGEPESKEPHKFKKVGWHKIGSLPKNLSGTARHVLKMYRKGNSYSEYRKQPKPNDEKAE